MVFGAVFGLLKATHNMKVLLAAVATATLLIPATTFADLYGLTSATAISSPVAPSGTVNANVWVLLTESDDWRSTRVEVSIPGPNNDIDICVNTADKFSSNHVPTEVSAPLSFTAPDGVGNYTVEMRAFENSNCTGKWSTEIEKPLIVEVAAPPAPPAPPVQVQDIDCGDGCGSTDKTPFESLLEQGLVPFFGEWIPAEEAIKKMWEKMYGSQI